jgi:hypothetical protein
MTMMTHMSVALLPCIHDVMSYQILMPLPMIAVVDSDFVAVAAAVVVEVSLIPFLFSNIIYNHNVFVNLMIDK